MGSREIGADYIFGKHGETRPKIAKMNPKSRQDGKE